MSGREMGIWSCATTGEVHFEISCFGFIDISLFPPVNCFGIHPCDSCSSSCGCPLGDKLGLGLSPLTKSYGLSGACELVVQNNFKCGFYVATRLRSLLECVLAVGSCEVRQEMCYDWAAGRVRGERANAGVCT